jgi:lysozyme family protein
MADFISSIFRVLLIEGKYVIDPNDRGGETYRGISRKNFPHWAGWVLIDNAKHQPNFPSSLAKVPGLDQLVSDFYKHNFWDKIDGDFISNQIIANQLLDTAVNCGIPPAIKMAQQITSLPETGVIDEILVKRLNAMR